MMALMCSATAWRDWGVEAGLPVMIRLPLAVHLMAASCTCGGDIRLNFSLRERHSTSGVTRFLLSFPNLARSTTRLGLGGLDPAIAVKVQGLGGAFPVPFCVLGLGAGCLFEEGVAFFKPSIALVSEERVSWIFCSSRLSEGGGGGGAGVSPSSSISLMMGCEIKERSSGCTLVSLALGVEAMITSSRVLNILSGGCMASCEASVGTFDMVVV